MTDIFISYSRKDIAFASMLHKALLENDLNPWIDWQDIPPSADWLAEVYEAIEGADNFVFVISETSLDSEICGLEIAHAAKHNKRLIPIVINDIEADKVPNELSVLNWIFFGSGREKFSAAMNDLVSAIKVDQTWVKSHTRFENRALDWKRKEMDRGLLLRGTDLLEAETWLAGSAGKDPQPTALQTQFIIKSREDVSRRQRLTLIGVIIGLMVAVGLGIIAWMQRNVAVSEGNARATAESEAVTQRDEAELQRSIAVSRQLAVQSTSIIDSQLDLALLLSVESCRTSQTLECQSSLLNALSNQPFLERVLHSGAEEPEFSVWAVGSMLAFSPDSSLLAAATGDNTILFWDIVTGESVGQPLVGLDMEATALAFSPDGKILAAGTRSQKVLLWDVNKGELIGEPLIGSIEYFEYDVHSNFSIGIKGLTFTPDGGRIIAACKNGDIIVWNVTSGELVSESLGKDRIEGSWGSAYMSMALSPYGLEMASGLDDGSIELALTQGSRSFDKKIRLNEEDSKLIALALSPDSQMVAGANLDDEIIFWDLNLDEQINKSPLEGHTSQINSLVFSPDGSMLASGGYDNTVILWDVNYKKAIGHPLTGHNATVIAIAFSDNGKWLASLDRLGNTLLWNVERDGPIFIRRWEPNSQNDLISIAFDFESNQETFVSASINETDSTCIIRQWDFVAGVESAIPVTVPCPIEILTYLHLNQDGSLMITQEDKKILLWDSRTGAQIGELLNDELIFSVSPDVNSIAIVPNGQCYRNSISLWDLYHNQQIGEPLIASLKEGPPAESCNYLTEVAYNSDGSLLAAGSFYGDVMLWDIEKGDPIPLSFITNDDGKILDLEFSPNGNVLAAGSKGSRGSNDSSIELWDLSTGQSLWPTSSDLFEETIDLAFSPDSRILATVTNPSPSGDTSVALWDVSSGRFIGWLGWLGYTRGFNTRFSPDGESLIWVDDNAIVIADLRIEAWQEYACYISNRNMTASEWASYFPDEPCRPICPNLPNLCDSN